jgi:hypothetical protein
MISDTGVKEGPAKAGVTLAGEGGVLLVRTPYHAGFVAALKALPGDGRRYDPERRAWRVALRHADQVVDWCEAYFGASLKLPRAARGAASERRTFELTYLSDSRDRGTAQPAALGWHAGQWRYRFPEGPLRAWFDGGHEPDGGPSHYQRLGLGPDAGEPAIRTAYRRLARQWHPDVCTAPDAHERFLVVQSAYEALQGEAARDRYRDGLLPPVSPGVEAHINGERRYRPPVRCGRVTALVTDGPGLAMVELIMDWQPLVNAEGRVLNVRWPPGAKAPRERWV